MGVIYILLATLIWFKYRSIKGEAALVGVVTFIAMISASLSTSGDVSSIMLGIVIGFAVGILYAAIGMGVAAIAAFLISKVQSRSA
jgi:hypothetical protein